VLLRLNSRSANPQEFPVRRVCVTNIVAHTHERSPGDGSRSSTQFLMAILIAAVAAAMVTLGAMLGWRIDT